MDLVFIETPVFVDKVDKLGILDDLYRLKSEKYRLFRFIKEVINA